MQVTREQYMEAMIAIENFSLCRPEAVAEFDRTINILSYCAGMWAAAEPVHYTLAQFRAALSTLREATPEFCTWTPRVIKPIKNEAPKAGNKTDRKRADLIGAQLGLMDRDGMPYLPAQKLARIAAFKAQQD